jgi:Domain of unknown function (DUF4375)
MQRTSTTHRTLRFAVAVFPSTSTFVNRAATSLAPTARNQPSTLALPHHPSKLLRRVALSCGSSPNASSTDANSPMSTRPATFKIPRPASEANLVGEVLNVIWKHADFYSDEYTFLRSGDPATKGQLGIYAATWYISEVANGGHQQFFKNSAGMVWQQALAGFTMPGARKHKAILQQAHHNQRQPDSVRGGGSPAVAIQGELRIPGREQHASECRRRRSAEKPAGRANHRVGNASEVRVWSEGRVDCGWGTWDQTATNKRMNPSWNRPTSWLAACGIVNSRPRC